MLKHVQRTDRSVDLKRIMSEMRKPDRDLQSQMPVGESMEVILQTRKLLIFRGVVGRMRVICVSPTRSLLAGETPQPLRPAEVNKILSEIPQAIGGVPSTIVLMSTSGFTIEAHELAERRADRTVVMAEPNKAGGWAVYGPVETKELVDLFDPEAEESKRDRVREEVAAHLQRSGGGGDFDGQNIIQDPVAVATGGIGIEKLRQIAPGPGGQAIGWPGGPFSRGQRSILCHQRERRW